MTIWGREIGVLMVHDDRLERRENLTVHQTLARNVEARSVGFWVCRADALLQVIVVALVEGKLG